MTSVGIFSSTSGPEQLAGPDCPIEHLRISECIFARRPAMITTVLGSCVSATFYHPTSSVAAIFHAMLPICNEHADGGRSCKYVDVAVDEIMARFARLEIRRGELDVKLFGGGFTIDPERKGAVRDIVDVGSKNVQAARDSLTRHGLKITAEDVLGRRGRKVFFLTTTGEVWIRPLSSDQGDLDPSLF